MGRAEDIDKRWRPGQVSQVVHGPSPSAISSRLNTTGYQFAASGKREADDVGELAWARRVQGLTAAAVPPDPERGRTPSAAGRAGISAYWVYVAALGHTRLT